MSTVSANVSTSGSCVSSTRISRAQLCENAPSPSLTRSLSLSVPLSLADTSIYPVRLIRAKTFGKDEPVFYLRDVRFGWNRTNHRFKENDCPEVTRITKFRDNVQFTNWNAQLNPNFIMNESSRQIWATHTHTDRFWECRRNERAAFNMFHLWEWIAHTWHCLCACVYVWVWREGQKTTIVSAGPMIACV